MVTSVAVYGYASFPHRADFFIFYMEGLAWNAGEALHAQTVSTNTNPPTLTVLLFGPIASVPLPIAQGLWGALGIAGFCGALSTVRRELSLSADRTIVVAALLLLTHGAWIVTLHGQLTWLLLYPTTRAWVSYRRGDGVAAGLWLA